MLSPVSVRPLPRQLQPRGFYSPNKPYNPSRAAKAQLVEAMDNLENERCPQRRQMCRTQ